MEQRKLFKEIHSVKYFKAVGIYKAQNGGHLVMLNSKKELNINPSQAQFFIFNKD